ncbi:MAG: elongation factor Ts [Mycoplasmataceae bacterium]|nr:elongation factor Ts [Mycoplasmataceae bacterium]
MSAQLVKELRERTGAGFLDCKKALEASSQDIEKAIEWLQERGAAKAAKKAGAIAAEGIVQIVTEGSKSVIFELNSQTDFVSTNEQFLKVSSDIGKALIENEFSTVEEANAIMLDGTSVADLCIKATATIGEKIVLRRAASVVTKDGESIGAYVHVNKRVGAIVIAKGGKDDTTRNVAMHVASMNPVFLDETSVPAKELQAMKDEIASDEMLLTKPEKIRGNIAAGMLRKKLSELTLVDQEFVMEKMPVKKYLSNTGATAVSMVRFEVGDGIEKKEEDFAAEVAAQMNK